MNRMNYLFTLLAILAGFNPNYAQNTLGFDLQNSSAPPYSATNSRWQNDSIQYFKLVGDSLQFYRKQLNCIDEKGRLTDALISVYDEANKRFYTAYNNTYEYDNKDQRIHYIGQIWDTINKIWINSSKIDWSYNAHRMAIHSLTQNWDKNSKKWYNTYRREITFNSDGLDTIHLQQKWDKTLDKWINFSRSIRTFNPDGKVILSYYQTWDTKKMKWISRFKDLFTWQDPSLLEVNITMNYNISKNDWENKTLRHYYHNEKALLDSLVINQWNATNTKWEKHIKVNETYDINDNLMVIIVSLWDKDIESWNIGREEKRFWSEVITTRISNLKEISPLVYPNPFDTDIFVHTRSDFPVSRIEISDRNGRLLISATKQNHLDLSVLPAGMYILKCINGQAQKSTVIIKQ